MYEAKAFWKSKDFWKLKLEQAENYIVGNRARWRKNHKCNRNSHIFNCTKHQSSSYYGTVKSNNYNHLWYFWFQIPYVKTQCIRVAAETSCIACLRMKKKLYIQGFRSGGIQSQHARAASAGNRMLEHWSKQESNIFFKKKHYLTWNRSAPR